MAQEFAQVIRGEMERHGAMPFERFMALALYHPEWGYYERGLGQTGRAGDYYTSVSVGRVFGRLLAQQSLRWLAEAGLDSGMLVEAGAHDGTLARDILEALEGSADGRAGGVTYWIVEPSLRRRAIQRGTLAKFGEQVRWVGTLEALARESEGGRVRGIIFGNELLDAMPVRRLGWDAKQRCWYEWGVADVGGRFSFARLSGEVAAGAGNLKWRFLNDLPEQVTAALPHGFCVELGEAAEAWWAQAASLLERGFLMAIDYGMDTWDCLVPERVSGTLRGYREHRQVEDLLAAPGLQDLTASVDFGILRKRGEASGLQTVFDERQEAFLARVLAGGAQGDEALAAWSPAERRQLVTLMHPAHLGRAFRVLVQRACCGVG